MTGTPASPSVGTRRGLEPAEVAVQRAKFGANVLTPPPRDPWWRQFLSKFDDPVIRILLIAAFIAIAAGSIHGEYIEGIGIIVAVLLATGLAFVNEFKANREFDILNQVNDEIPIKVIRGGGYTTTPIRDIVVGDIVFIEAGEEVPADGILLEAVALQVVESALTGEPDPNRKVAGGEVVEGRFDATIPADRMMRGTRVVDGHGIFEVIAVGDSTEFGKTARSGTEQTSDETPLKLQLGRLSKIIGVVGLGVAAATFAALLLRGAAVGELNLSARQWTLAAIFGIGAAIATILVWLPMVYDGLHVVGGWLGRQVNPPEWLSGDGPSLKHWLKFVAIGIAFVGVGLGLGSLAGIIPSGPGNWLPDGAAGEFLKYFMIAVTIIVVAVPEGLAMSVTLSLAYSMRKMTASNTLVRKMDACETIGATTVICTDKTGTLTMNEMRVFAASLPALGDRPLNTKAADNASRLIVEGLAVNTTAHLDFADPAQPKTLGNPTEGALLLWLHDLGIDYPSIRRAFKVLVQLTFSTERKYMATLGTSGDGIVMYVKGAPEIILAQSTQVQLAEGHAAIDTQRDALLASLKDYQSRGMRTLGLAYRTLADGNETMNLAEHVHDLIWLGFVAIADPIRPEVPDAIKACRAAGIRVKIVTGDNPETAREIARQIGLTVTTADASSRMRGPDFEKLSNAEAEEASSRLSILSRAKPLDKVRLVRSLQSRGEIVAVTGDGINDCGALNLAHVGLAMGRTGKAAAKEASDIILLDDSFGTIINAVMWGRSLYENIQRFILFQLTINVAALGVALLGPFIGVKLPLTVIQMLWVNLIMDTFAALALATEPPHAGVLHRPPRDPRSFIITRSMAFGIFGVGLVFLVVLVGMLLYIQHDGIVTDYELSVFFSVFVMLQFWNLFNARCLGLTRSAFVNLFRNVSLLVIATAIFVGTILIVQFGGTVFRTVPLTFKDWLIVIASTSVVLWAGELHRLSQRMKTIQGKKTSP